MTALTTNPEVTPDQRLQLARLKQWVELKLRGPAMWSLTMFRHKQSEGEDIAAQVKDKADAEASYLISKFYLRVLPSERRRIIELLEDVNSWQLLSMEADKHPLRVNHETMTEKTVAQLKELLNLIVMRKREDWLKAMTAEQEQARTPNLFDG